MDQRPTNYKTAASREYWNVAQQQRSKPVRMLGGGLKLTVPSHLLFWDFSSFLKLNFRWQNQDILLSHFFSLNTVSVCPKICNMKHSFSVSSVGWKLQLDICILKSLKSPSQAMWTGSNSTNHHQGCSSCCIYLATQRTGLEKLARMPLFL